MKMIKKHIHRLILLFLIVMILCMSLAGCYGAEKPLTLDEHLELGMRYLSELDYENAVIAFSAAIEIDPKNVQAQTGLLVTQLAQENEAEALVVWTTIQAAGTETGTLLAGIFDTMDVLIEAGVDKEPLLTNLAAFLAKQENGAGFASAFLENAAVRYEDENLPIMPEELQEEVYTGELLPDSEEYTQLGYFLHQFRYGFYGTYDCRSLVFESTGELWESRVLLEHMLSPLPCYIDALYPGENGVTLWNFSGDWGEVAWSPDPLGKLGKYDGYAYVSKEKVEWILKNIFNCPLSAIEAMETPILNGKDEDRYVYEDRFYYEIGGVGSTPTYPCIENIHQIGQYYLVRYTIRQEYNDDIMGDYTALLKLKKIEESFYWSLYYNQEGFLLDEASWPYQEMPQIADGNMVPLLQVQPDTFLPETQRQNFTVTAEPSLNLRAGPGADYDRIGSVPKGMVVSEIGQSDSIPDWIVIKCQNAYEDGVGEINYGWISTEFIE